MSPSNDSSNKEPHSYKGQCLCGVIKYSVNKLEAKMGNCHCTMCRKFHGAAYATFGEALTENFHWLEGEKYLQDYKADNGTVRKFCKQCGSSMIFQVANDSGELVEFTLGTMDSDIEQNPDVHIYTENKANWLIIEDDLPKYLGDRNSKCL